MRKRKLLVASFYGIGTSCLFQFIMERIRHLWAPTNLRLLGNANSRLGRSSRGRSNQCSAVNTNFQPEPAEGGVGNGKGKDTKPTHQLTNHALHAFTKYLPSWKRVKWPIETWHTTICWRTALIRRRVTSTVSCGLCQGSFADSTLLCCTRQSEFDTVT